MFFRPLMIPSTCIAHEVWDLFLNFAYKNLQDCQKPENWCRSFSLVCDYAKDGHVVAL
jgi:hypothetical protein